MQLLLEEIFKGLAGVRVARRSRGSGAGGRRLSIGRWRGIFFDGRAEFVELARILRVLGRDALWDRLRAFELRAGIEETALFATVQFGLALGAGSVGIESRSEHRAAIRTARACDRADHARCARPELIGSARPAGGWLPVVRLILLLLLFRVAVTAVTVFPIHKRLRPPVSTDCNDYNSYFCAVALANLACIQSDCYTRQDGALIP